MSIGRFIQILPCLWALTSACVSDPTEGNPPPETTTNTLAFIQGGKLYITSADSGAVPRQIGEGYWHVNWSPDGSTLALVEPGTVALADADGGNVRVLHRVPGGGAGFGFYLRPVWSPDGMSLLLDIGSAHTHSLVSLSTIHPGGLQDPGLEQDPECVPVREMRAPIPSWSPDGRHIVMHGVGAVGDFYEFPVICMFSAAGKFERALLRGESPTWSPDGSRIAFVSVDSSIHTIAPDGTDERDLSPSSLSGPQEQGFAWSPDGGELSFLVHSPDEAVDSIYELWLMDALGGNRRRLVPQVKSHGAWSRDGARLAFLLPSGQLTVVKRDGTGLTPVSPMGDRVSSWDWRP
jgi:Tol biopolymer transport system component